MHEYIVETFKVHDKTVKIIQDSDAESPRDWDNLGTMATWHDRARELGDEHWNRHTGEIDENVKDLRARGAIMLPLWLYEHSGMSMRAGEVRPGYPFNDEWDSGQVGFIYVLPATIRKEYSVKRITRKVREQVIACLKAEVETFDQYLTGDVYGYVIEDAAGNDLDSCWGFFGIETVKAEATGIAEGMDHQLPLLASVEGAA